MYHCTAKDRHRHQSPELGLIELCSLITYSA